MRDMHARIVALATAHGVLPAAFAEMVLAEEVDRRVHAATIVADAVRAIPAAGIRRDRQE